MGINMSVKLATFKIEEEKWRAFQEVADKEGSNASAMLKDFIDWVLAGKRLRLEKTQSIDTDIDAKLTAIREEFRQQIENLRRELVA